MGHALIDLMIVGEVVGGDEAFGGEVLVLEVLVGFLEV